VNRTPWLCLLLLTGCATAQVALPPEQVSSLERRLTNDDRFLRVSCYSTPFFGDDTKKLLTAVLPEQVRLLDDPQGQPISPGAVEATFGAGTPVRITKIEFPSAMVMAQRVLYTPRTLVWVYLDVGGTPKGSLPWVLVLRPGLTSEEELLTELDRYVTREDPTRRMESWPDAMRDAVRSKTAQVGMPGEALEMAWGYPAKKKIELEGDKRRETWTWADDKRTALLIDGRVVELK